MNRKHFVIKILTSVFALPLLSRLAQADSKSQTDIKSLENAYFKAAMSLVKYRFSNGFEPGVRVRAQYRDQPPMLGIIAPFGQGWNGGDHYCVPVILDKGYLQPWPMADLTVL